MEQYNILMQPVQLEQYEFEVRARVHSNRRVSFYKASTPVYIDRIIVHGQMISYDILVQKGQGEPEALFRGETDTEVIDDPIRVEAGSTILVEFMGPMTTELSLICMPGKKED